MPTLFQSRLSQKHTSHLPDRVLGIRTGRKKNMPRPVGVMCFICGREFGKASIAIHIPQCEKKWNVEQMKLPKKQRRPIPSKPEEYERIISGELKGKDFQMAMDQYNQQALEDFNTKSLLECKNCGRTFLAKPLEIHSRSCKPGTER